MSDGPKNLHHGVREVLRFIQQKELPAGAALPRQVELRQRLQIDSNALSQALRLLVVHGVIRRTKGQGTFLLDPECMVPGTWRVGLVMPTGELPSGLIATIYHHLRGELDRLGAYDRTLHLRPPGPGQRGVAAEGLPGRRLDVIVTAPHAAPLPVHDATAALCHVGLSGDAPEHPGVVIPLPSVLATLGTALRRRRIRRVALVDRGLGVGLAAGMAAEALARTLGRPPLIIAAPDGSLSEQAQAITAGVGAMPSAKRPAAVIVLDSRVALAVAGQWDEGGGRLPVLATLGWGLPGHEMSRLGPHLRIDAAAVARQVAGCIRAMLLWPQRVPPRETYLPALAGGE